MVTAGFILVVLVQQVCGWAGCGISWLWFRRLLALLFLANHFNALRLSNSGIARGIISRSKTYVLADHST